MQSFFTTFLVVPITIASPVLAALAAVHAPGHLFQKRDFLCPVVCDNTWCCLTGQVCQETSNNDTPYECADTMLDATDSAFALGGLSSMVESVISENNAFISSLTSELSLTLSFSSFTLLPDPIEETKTSERPVEKTSSGLPNSLSKLGIEHPESSSDDFEARRTTQAVVTSTTLLSSAEASERESAESIIETLTWRSTTDTSEARDNTEETAGAQVTGGVRQETSSSDSVSTTTSDGAAPTPLLQWQSRVAMAWMAVVVIF